MNRRIAVLILSGIFIIIASIEAMAADENSFEIFTRGLEQQNQLLIFKARDSFKSAIEMEPDNAGYLSHYAWFLTSYGFIEEAAYTFERLLVLTNDKKSVYLGIGFTNQQLGRFDTSLSAYKKCLPITSSDYKTAFEQIREELSRENEAKIESLVHQIKAQDNPSDSQKELLKVYIDQGELSKAVTTAESLRRQEDLDIQTHLWFARALYWQGMKIRAETEYNSLISLSPRSAFLHMELAELLESDDLLYEAKKMLEKAIDLNPDAKQARKKLAEVYARMGYYHKAKEMAYSIEEDEDNRLTGMMAKARVFHFIGLIEESRIHYSRALKIYPYNADALWGMAETSLYSGKYTDALRTIDRWEKNLSDSRLENQKRLAHLYTSPLAELRMEFYQNSSGFLRKNAGSVFSIYTGDDLRIGSEYCFSAFSQKESVDVSRHSLSLSGEKYISSFIQINGRIVGNFYSNDNNLLNTRIGATLSVSPRLSISPYFRHFDIIDTIEPFENAMYSHVVTIGSVGMGITSNEFGLKMDCRPLPRFSFLSDYQYGAYSDGNIKQAMTIGSAYRLALQPDWRVAYYYFYLDYKDPAPIYMGGEYTESAYFDPINFETHTLSIIYQHDKGGVFSWGAEGSFSFLPKSNGIGTLLSSFGKLRLNDNLVLCLDLRWFYNNKSVDRIGETEFFRAKNIYFTFDYRF